MTQQFAVQAWPSGGFAEMTVAVFNTEHEAQQDKALRAARYPRWRFRVATVVTEEHAT
jgi:hypothetical protein